MNTFGLKKKGLNPFWLKPGKLLTTTVVSGWKDVIRFTVFLKRKLLSRVEL